MARAEAEAEQGLRPSELELELDLDLRLSELEAAYQAYSEALKARVAAEEGADTARAAEESAEAAVLALASQMISIVSSPNLIKPHQPTHAIAHHGVPTGPHLMETYHDAEEGGKALISADARDDAEEGGKALISADARDDAEEGGEALISADARDDAEEGGEALISADASGTLADYSPLARARRQLQTFRGQMASLAEAVAKAELETARVVVDSEVVSWEAAATEEGGAAVGAAEPPPPSLPPSAARRSPTLSSPALSSVIKIGLARIAHEQSTGKSTASTCSTVSASVASPSTWSRAVSAAPLLRRVLDSAERGEGGAADR